MIIHYFNEDKAKKLRELHIHADTNIKRIFARPFAGLPFIKYKALPHPPKGFSVLAIIGMGGASLGAKTIMEALPSFTKIPAIFFDTIDPSAIQEKLAQLKNKKIVLIHRPEKLSPHYAGIFL